MRAHAVIQEARRWVGTPYRHQHRSIGLGVDCIGLIWGVGEAVGVLEVDPGKVRRFLAYSRSPSPTRFLEALGTFFAGPFEQGEPGDVCAMAWNAARDIPQHVAILAENDGKPSIIHAHSQIGRCVEHGFTGEWPGRVHSWWRYPGL